MNRGYAPRKSDTFGVHITLADVFLFLINSLWSAVSAGSAQTDFAPPFLRQKRQKFTIDTSPILWYGMEKTVTERSSIAQRFQRAGEGVSPVADSDANNTPELQAEPSHGAVGASRPRVIGEGLVRGGEAHHR